MADLIETASEALGTSLLVGLETHIQGGELSMRLWERTGGGGLFSTEHTKKLVSSVSRKPAEWGRAGLGPSFLQHLDFQAKSNHPSCCHSAPWRTGSPTVCAFCILPAQRVAPHALAGSCPGLSLFCLLMQWSVAAGSRHWAPFPFVLDLALPPKSCRFSAGESLFQPLIPFFLTLGVAPSC